MTEKLRITYKNQPLTGWRRWMVMAGAIVILTVAFVGVTIMVAVLVGPALAYRVWTGRWPEWFKVEMAKD